MQTKCSAANWTDPKGFSGEPCVVCVFLGLCVRNLTSVSVGCAGMILCMRIGVLDIHGIR